MRKVVVEVFDKCSPMCPLAHYAGAALYTCPFRFDNAFSFNADVKPVKACREAEVKHVK